MRKSIVLLGALFLLCTFSVSGQATSELKLLTASNHPMQYYLSLPKGWNKNTKWPVAVVLEAADKQYKLNADRFISTRGDLPFILVAPINTNNGNQGRRDPTLFPYSTETWDYMEKVGDCQFNDEGLKQIISDVARLYGGEEKVYMTGFEAGTHVLWSIVFNHPEYLNAAASVAGNFRDRCVEDSKVSKDPSRINLPIRSFVGEKDEYFAPGGKVYDQWVKVRDLASKHGYENVGETVPLQKDHVPMPEAVWGYFGSLIGKK